MKIKNHKKLLRFISFATCLFLITETLSGYGILNASAAANSQILTIEENTSNNDSITSNDKLSNDLLSNDTSLSNTTSSNNTSLSDTTSSNNTSSSVSTSSNNTTFTNEDTNSSLDTINLSIDESNFPDLKFRDYIIDNIDSNKDSKLSTEELNCITIIDVSNLDIASLDGLAYFTNLKELNCSNNKLSSLTLDTLTNLTSLNCSWNHLLSLDLTNNSNLTKVECIANAKAILLDDNNSFDLNILANFNIDHTTNWSCDYTIENNILTFNKSLDSSIITFTSNLNYFKNKEDNIEFAFAIYKEALEHIEINEVTFPDIEFYNLISTFYDVNKDNVLDSEELVNITIIDISKYNITDLTGIQYFKNLAYFNYNTVQSKDVDTNTLPITTKIYCDNSPLIRDVQISLENTSTDIVITDVSNELETPANISLFNTDSSINSSVSADTAINKTIEYSISYILNDGTNSIDAPTVFTVEDTKALPLPSRKECRFDGWYLDNNFTTPISSITPDITQNITLYAKWTQLSVTSTTDITSVKTSSKGKLSVSYNQMDGVIGYEVLCSTSKNFTSNIRTTTSAKTNLTVTGLIKNKTYYVKVRGYLVDSSGQKVYGNYSSVKKIKIKSGIEEATATSTSARISSCKITNSDTVTIKAKASKIIKSNDSYYYLFRVPSTQNNLKKLQPIATSEKSTSVTFTTDLDKNGSNNSLQSKFVIAIKQKSSYKIISAFRYISNPESVAKYTYAFPTAPTKKGLQGYASDIGINHTILNIEVNDFIATESEYASKSTDKYNYKGKTYYFRRSVAKQFAYTAKEYSEDGAIVYAILLLSWSSKTNLITPAARKYGYPYYAWNMKDKNVKEQLEATITYFAEFCCKVCGDRPGISGWIVGNEVDNFDTWNYAGTSKLNTYAKNYADTFRLVYNATKSVYSNARVYVSLDHMWAMSNEGSFGSKAFLDAFHSILKSEGNIDWDIAYHPYPVPLTETNFWNNDFLSNNDDSPIVNIKNLNVLTNYVKKHYGKDKRIILSEVGFTSTSGEKLQAAAIAYAYYIAEFNPMVDAFIMRSLHDAEIEIEQGLNFGIKHKYAYNVYKYMDTPQSERYTKFALKIIKAKSWKSIVSKYKASKFQSMPNR